MAEAFAGFGDGGFEGVEAVVAGDGEQAVEVGRAAADDVVDYADARRRQDDMACAVQRQHQAAADDIAQGAIGLFPPPRLAQELRKPQPAGGWMLLDEASDEGRVLFSEVAASVAQQDAPLAWHGKSVSDRDIERKFFGGFTTKPAPRRSSLGRQRIAAGQQHLQFVRRQPPRLLPALICRPEPEAPR